MLGGPVFVLVEPAVLTETRRAIAMINPLAFSGIAFLVTGFVVEDSWLVCYGAVATQRLRLWFLDRTDHLHADLVERSPIGDPNQSPPPSEAIGSASLR